jgi:hypothetical protein
VHEAGLRRLSALTHGLPPEAGIWREQQLPPVEDFLASLIERFEEWQRAQFLLAAGKRVAPPGVIRVIRPGQTEESEHRRPMVTDPRTIAAWFAQHVSG